MHGESCSALTSAASSRLPEACPTVRVEGEVVGRGCPGLSIVVVRWRLHDRPELLDLLVGPVPGRHPGRRNLEHPPDLGELADVQCPLAA